MNEKTFKAKNCNLNYFHSDIGSKQNLFLIHGWMKGWEEWFDLISKYKGKYNIYAVDLPGHNKSGKLEEYNIENYFEPISEFLQFINNDLILVGHSLGASLSFLLAYKYKFVTKIVLEDPPWYSENRGEILKNINKDELIDSQLKKYESMRNFFLSNKDEWRTSIDAFRSIKEYYADAYQLNPEGVIMRSIWAFHHDKNIWNVSDDWVWQDAINISKNVKTKTLIIGGNIEKGAVLNKEIAREVKKNINDCQLKYIDSGHNIRLEKPLDYYKNLDKFI